MTGIFSAKGWEYWQAKRADTKAQDEQERLDTHLYRDDLRKEVTRLREENVALYAKRDKEIQEHAEAIADLKAKLAEMTTRVEYLEKENTALKEKEDQPGDEE